MPPRRPRRGCASWLQGAREIAADLNVVLRAIEVACAAVAEATPPPVADTPSTARRGLSPRQGQILERLLAGSRDREIAKELGISVSTVKAHVRAPLPILGLALAANCMSSMTIRSTRFRQRGLVQRTSPFAQRLVR